MEKEEFKNELNSLIDNMSEEENRKLIQEISDFLPNNIYEKIIFTAKNIKDTLNISFEDIEMNMNTINENYKKIKDEIICFKCYSTNYGDDYEYLYSYEINNIINEAFEFGKKLIYYKEYYRAIEVFELILYTKYGIEEVGDPEFADTDDVYNSWDVCINDAKHILDFDLDYVYLYLIYACLASNHTNKYEKICNYLSDCNSIIIDDCLNLGIEKIRNLDKFYKEFKNYLERKKDENAKRILDRLFEK